MPRDAFMLIGTALFASLIAVTSGLGSLASAADASQDGNQNCCDASNSGCGTPSYGGARVALIVGNDNYGGVLQKLSNGANDARAMAEIVKSNYRFRCLLNLDRVGFNRELDAFRKYIEVTAEQHKSEAVDARALLYFSGHGFSVENENYIVLSGNVADKADLVDNHARLVSGIAATIGSHINFSTNLIFDSCRNFIQGQAIKPDFADKGFATQAEFKGLDIIFSTGPLSFARDEFDETNRTNNGAYVHTVKAYSIYDGLTAGQLLVSNVKNDPGMRALGQAPSSAPGDFFDAYSWTGVDSDCSRNEAVVVNSIGFCRSSGNPMQCMKKLICHNLQLMSLEVPVCPQAKLQASFPNELTACNAVAQAGSLSDLVKLTAVSGPSPASAASTDQAAAATAIQSQAERKQLASLWRSALSGPLAQIDNLRVLPGNQTALRTQTTKIQQGINQQIQASNDVLASARTIGVLPSATVNADIVELKVVPSAISGTTGPIKTKGPLVANCALLPCTDDYVMAQVATDKGALKGWIEADKIAPAPPTCSASLEYSDDSPTPTAESLVSLRKAVSKDCAGPDAKVSIVAVVPPNSDDVKLLAVSRRVTLVRNSLFGTSIDPEKVSVTFAQPDDAGSAKPITLQIYR